MTLLAEIPSRTELRKELADKYEVWCELQADLGRHFAGLTPVWKSAKTEFGRMCLFKQKERTLLYAIPRRSVLEVAMVLGERAVALAMTSDISDEKKTLLAEAKRCAEGRAIRVYPSSISEIPEVRRLVQLKVTPK